MSIDQLEPADEGGSDAGESDADVSDEGVAEDGLPGMAIENLAERVREARKEAGITQVELARRLGKSQPFVSQAECGTARIGMRYVDAVVQACGLPADWGAPNEGAAGVLVPDSGWDIPREQMAGLDPETLLPVRRGCARDMELRAKLVWWTGRLGAEW